MTSINIIQMYHTNWLTLLHKMHTKKGGGSLIFERLIQFWAALYPYKIHSIHTWFGETKCKLFHHFVNSIKSSQAHYFGWYFDDTSMQNCDQPSLGVVIIISNIKFIDTKNIDHDEWQNEACVPLFVACQKANLFKIWLRSLNV